jgi:hypothetical protein
MTLRAVGNIGDLIYDQQLAVGRCGSLPKPPAVEADGMDKHALGTEIGRLRSCCYDTVSIGFDLEGITVLKYRFSDDGSIGCIQCDEFVAIVWLPTAEENVQPVLA